MIIDKSTKIITNIGTGRTYRIFSWQPEFGYSRKGKVDNDHIIVGV